MRYLGNKTTVLMAIMFLISACYGESRAGSEVRDDLADRPESTYLKEIIPPCTPVHPSQDTSCPSTPFEIVESSSSSGGPIWAVTGKIPTLVETLLGDGYPGLAPHIVLRGATLKDSTRCALYPYDRFPFDTESRIYKNVEAARFRGFWAFWRRCGGSRYKQSAGGEVVVVGEPVSHAA